MLVSQARRTNAPINGPPVRAQMGEGGDLTFAVFKSPTPEALYPTHILCGAEETPAFLYIKTINDYLHHYIEDFSSGKLNKLPINMYTKSMFSDLITVFHCFF